MTRAVSIAQSGANNVTMRNRIINGAMMIDQRNAGASVSMSSGSPYILDRWRFWANGVGGSAAYTVQQSSTAPVGFSKSVLITQTAAYSPTGTQYNIFAQYIEGLNVADLGWGAVGASAVTLSFWVRSSLTGTFGGVLSNSAQDRSYAFTYTINSANTWEQKTITVPGDTSGTWLTTNGIGLEVYWQLGVGSGYLGAPGSWAGATYLGATGTTNFTATNGATLYITGVQLEAGTTATPFEQRLYGTELALCQRYYQTATQNTATAISSTSVLYPWRAVVTMRARPSTAIGGTGAYSSTAVYYENAPWVSAGSTSGMSALSQHASVNGGDVNVTGTYSPSPSSGQLVCVFNQNAQESTETNKSWLILSAEL